MGGRKKNKIEADTSAPSDVTGLTVTAQATPTDTADKNAPATPTDTSDKTVPAESKPENSEDSTAPSDVTSLNVSCVNGTDGKVNAVLTWIDPSNDDGDLFGMEVTYVEKQGNGRSAIAAMAKDSIFVAPGNGGTIINDLPAGSTYTFTVKTMDINGNKSDGTSKDATMTLNQLSELKITLTPSTTENKTYTVAVLDYDGRLFSGDLDGSDNWDVICSVDSTARENAATNYPAFNFAANYGTTTCGFGENDDLASGYVYGYYNYESNFDYVLVVRAF